MMHHNSLHQVKKPKGGNSLAFSRLYNEDYFPKSLTPGIAIKYVLQGREVYTYRNNMVDVNEKEYLLLNKGEEYDAFASSNTRPYPILGLCFNLDESMVLDVYRNFNYSEAYLLDNPFITETMQFDFMHGVYNEEDSLLNYLKSLESSFNRENHTLSVDETELYYNLATKLLQSQSVVAKQIEAINIRDLSVRKELYRRLLIARKLINESSEHLMIKDIAKAATLSQFHFFRTFRQAFGITPHQYQLKIKLRKAASLLVSENSSVENAAYQCGFSDIYTFSKVFKKHYTVPPSVYKKQKAGIDK